MVRDITSGILKYIHRLMGGIAVVWTRYDKQKYARAYETNAYVFAIINKIAIAFQNVRFMTVRDREDGTIEEVKDNELAKLLEDPNPYMDKGELSDRICREYFIYGESFLFGTRKAAGGNNNGKVDKDGLLPVNPELVDIKSKNGIVPEKYIIGGFMESNVDPGNMLHIKNYNPDWKSAHGLSLINVAGKLIDKLDAADEVEVRNFQNGGPAWIASAKDADSFSETQYTNLIHRFKSLWKKDSNKGSIIGTSGAINIQHVGKSPADLATTESIKETVKSLAMVFGLDPGTFDVEASTYNNKELMEKALYTFVVLPFALKYATKLTWWLGGAYGNVRVEVDGTAIEILQSNKKELVSWMKDSEVFSDNEIREALSYDRIEDERLDQTPAEKIEQEALTGFDEDDLNEDVI